MSTEKDFLLICAKRGVQLVPTPDGGLDVVGPEGALTADLLAKLREHKRELLAALTAERAENDKGKKDSLSEPAPPPADRADLASPTAAADSGPCRVAPVAEEPSPADLASPTAATGPAADPSAAGRPAADPAAPGDPEAPAVADLDAPADLTNQPPWLGDGTTSLLDKLGAAGCRPDALPDGKTFVADCPRCRQRRALSIRDTAEGVAAVKVHCPCGDAAMLALDGFEPLGIGAPRRRPAKRPRGPGCCPRCGHDRCRDVVIHGGQSVRRDCARCGFLIGFPLWYGTNDPDLAPAAGDDPTADRHGDAPAGPGAAADDGPVTPYWPRWAVQFHLRLVRAGCDPRIITATGEAGRKVLALQATCPACRRAGALTAWPWTSGMMFARCRGGCERREIHDALDAAAPLAECERLCP